MRRLGRWALSRRGLLLGSATMGLLPGVVDPRSLGAAAQSTGGGVVPGAREIPARPLPVPDTVSQALKPAVAAPLPAGWDRVPSDAAGWRALAEASGAHAGPALEAVRTRLGVTLERTVLGGVPVFVSTPTDMPEARRGRVLMHLHGGGYVLYPGEVGAGEGMMMAGYGRYTVVSVDYRMAPDHPFPAALDDAIAVWTALLATNRPERMAIFGTSAGGGLTLATLLRARQQGLPLPAAIAPGSPWADLTRTGDTLFANALVDNVLGSMDGWVGAAALLYAGGRDLRDPLISPINGDFSGFPPAILTSGTRDLLLSDTVRTHRKLRQAGVEAALQVFEAQSHAQFLKPFTPETEEAFAEIARFLERHLAG
ncbi:alpha/beta hydrolase [uncultured Alsobacter sp.]|uniref:alpha/beta hydrolase n=1 Tax=uncultured Alsobacter sp. TaxID=1748258 RepID=UPI0025DA43D1|nr:alpha/beta hydrolase [uncultured Alsobacter sp.]